MVSRGLKRLTAFQPYPGRQSIQGTLFLSAAALQARLIRQILSWVRAEQRLPVSQYEWVRIRGTRVLSSLTVPVPALDVNFVPTSSDTLALNRGMTLSYFSNDRLGTSRPQDSAWDIGAFEFSSGTIAPPTPTLEAPSNLRLISNYDK